jgi:dolichyl-phosphate-mannose--protein O-mannosyl transferase
MVYAASMYDSYSVWMLKGPHGKPEDYNRDKPVNNGDIIRLEHLLTKRNLHSHGDRLSPISQQQEVTAWGSNGICDENDNWRVEVEGGGELLAGKQVRLIHCITNVALHSHIASRPEFLDGNQEVTGFGDRDNNDFWIIES